MRADKKVMEYVRESLLIGVPLREIKRGLFKNGWKRHEIDAAIKTVERTHAIIERRRSRKIGVLDWVILAILISITIGGIIFLISNFDVIVKFFQEIKSRILK